MSLFRDAAKGRRGAACVRAVLKIQSFDVFGEAVEGGLPNGADGAIAARWLLAAASAVRSRAPESFLAAGRPRIGSVAVIKNLCIKKGERGK